MSERIHAFLEQAQPESPCLVVDLDIVRANYCALKQAMPETRIYYAIKANPHPDILAALNEEEASFDCASLTEIEDVLALGVAPGRISYSNTIKKEADISTAFGLGIRLFAFDCQAELEKLARSAPEADVICRLLTDCAGADWPLSRKFGCTKDHAKTLLSKARTLNLRPRGVSFHVGSQQTDPDGWETAISDSAYIFRALKEDGINLDVLNLGGGFPTRFLEDIPAVTVIARNIETSLDRHFGTERPHTIIEPGRGLVGSAGIIKAEVVLIAEASEKASERWVYLDIGKFGGLAETMDEAIRYPISTPHDGSPTVPSILAGPTCDSVDVMYEKTPYPLPETLQIGDTVFIEATGAYTVTYSSVGFNGFAPLAMYTL